MATKIEVSPNSNWYLREVFVGEYEVRRLTTGTPLLLYYQGSFELLSKSRPVGGIKFKVGEGLGTDLTVWGDDLSLLEVSVRPEQLPTASFPPAYFFKQLLLYRITRQGSFLQYQKKGHPDYLKVINLEPDV